MNLHPILPDSELPEALKRPLKFGDLEQIQALNALGCRINEMDKRKEATKNGDLKYFKVTVELTGEYEVEVLAKNKAEAELLADEEDFDFDDIDFDYSNHAREVKPCSTK